MASNGSNGGIPPPQGPPPPGQQNVQQGRPAALPQQNAHQAGPALQQQNVRQQLNPQRFQLAAAHANLVLGWLSEDVPEPRRNVIESMIWPELHSRDDQDADD